MPNAHPTPARPQVRLVLGAVFVTFLAQMTLNPVIAPLSREVGLEPWQVGAIISVAAVMVVVWSPVWGRRSLSWGRKPVLVTAMTIGAATMAGFALLAVLGTAGVVTGTTLFVLMVLTRGIGFGSAIAAVAPTAQAYVANVTETEHARVKGMAGIGAAQGLAMVAGAVLGGVLSVVDLLASVVAVPVVLAVGVAVVALRLRREPRSELIAHPPRISPVDPRVWPFLLAGFGLFTALGFIQVTSGFLVQDRLGLDTGTAGVVNGGALLLAGVGMIFAQTVIVPRSGWAPPRLMWFGAALALLGFVVLLVDGGAIPLLAGMLAVGTGIGIAMPGFTAGPTLLMDDREQGGLAGLIGATLGLTFVVAPTASTALYSVDPRLPIGIGAVLLAAVTVFVLAHPRFRTLPTTVRPHRASQHAPD